MLRRVVKPAFLVSTAVVTVAALCAPASTASAAGAAPPAGDRIEQQVRSAMARMTVPEKVGQMFASYVYGDSATTEAPTYVAANHGLYGTDVDNGADLLARYHLGGIIYFTWSGNLANPQQTASLSNGLQQASMSAGNVPVQISTDQEGGVVNRIGAPMSVSPGNMAIGATFNPGNAYRAAAVTGSELRAMGINVDDAPVVDVNTNPRNEADGPRAFSDRTLTVSAFAAAAVAGYQQAGVAAQAKHFPGLGDTTVNTDNGIAVTKETKQQIMNTHIPPFRAAIAAGVKSIMAAHIVAPALDPSGLPASLSKPIITGLLRNTLNYDGVVATDALSAAALAGIPQNQVILDAINAGDDELLMPSNLPAAIQTVIDAVNAGTISQSRIDQSVHRILRMKAELGLFDNPYTTPSQVSSTVGAPAHLQTMADVARRSITLLRNDNGVLPLASTSGRHLLVTGWGVSTTAALAGALSARGLTTQRLWTGSPSQQTIAQAVAAAQSNDLTVVTTYNAWGDTTQQNLVNALLATGKPVVVAAVGAPYDIAYFPSAPTYLATYDYQPVSVTALADTLLGTDPTGHLPVTVASAAGDQTLFPYGSGTGYRQGR
jgi:beta-N-acetylhexosaminidase